MSIKLEGYIDVVNRHGLNTSKDATLAGTNILSGATTISGALVGTAGLTSATITDIDATNGTPTATQCLGGVIIHTSVTGAGTLTVPTGANLSLLAGTTVGSMFKTLYHNNGDQTVTITTAASGTTLVGGTAVVTTGKHMILTFVCTAADTWSIFLQTLM